MRQPIGPYRRAARLASALLVSLLLLAGAAANTYAKGPCLCTEDGRCIPAPGLSGVGSSQNASGKLSYDANSPA